MATPPASYPRKELPCQTQSPVARVLRCQIAYPKPAFTAAVHTVVPETEGRRGAGDRERHVEVPLPQRAACTAQGSQFIAHGFPALFMRFMDCLCGHCWMLHQVLLHQFAGLRARRIAQVKRHQVKNHVLGQLHFH
jgi:hypothetical protein